MSGFGLPVRGCGEARDIGSGMQVLPVFRLIRIFLEIITEIIRAMYSLTFCAGAFKSFLPGPKSINSNRGYIYGLMCEAGKAELNPLKKGLTETFK